MTTKLEHCCTALCAKFKNDGMRMTPLHHRAMPECYRLTSVSRDALIAAMQTAFANGFRATGPYIKLDGVRYVEIF